MVSMKRTRTLVLAILALVLLSQIPFAYRRYKLGRLNAAIQVVNSNRKIPNSEDPFVEYQGVMHVHSFLGGHSSGTFQEIVSAAQTNELKFVVMTEHAEKEIDTSAMTLQGMHGGVLFVNGNEVSTATGDRFLSVPGDASLGGADKFSTADIAANARARGAVNIIAYPDEFKSDGNGFAGVEVYNLFTNAKQYNRVAAFFDALWSRRRYPDLLFANFYRRPEGALKRWDAMLATGKSVATAGNDSHSNIGISLNDGSGKELVGLKLDPYETSFRLVRMHVLIRRDKSLDTNSLLEAIRAGHCFIGFDVFGDTSGFRFTASNGFETVIQGDEIPLQSETSLNVSLPVSGRIVVLKSGQTFLDETGVTAKSIRLTERGVYRVEVYLPQLGKSIGDQPWIISNPIYVR